MSTSLKGAYSADPVPPIAPSPTPAINGDPGEEPSLECHRGYQGSNHCSFPSASSEPRMIPSPSAGKQRERPPRTHQWDKTPNFCPTSPLPAARQRKKPTSPQVGPGSKAACLQPPGRGWSWSQTQDGATSLELLWAVRRLQSISYPC